MSIIAGFMVPHPPMIVPQVGRGSEEQIRKTIAAYEQVAEDIAALRPETILISSPHAVMYSDYFHISPGKGARGSFSRFGARSVSFDETYDTELVHVLEILAGEQDFPAGTLGEREKELDHGTMVPLYFIRQKYQDFRLVRIGLSGLALTEHYRLGQMIREAVQLTGRRAVYVASGDLSHKLQPYGPYGFAEEGPRYDERIMDVCGRAAFGELFDFDETFCEKAAECGHRSFVIMAGAFDRTEVEVKALSHEDVTGVGYGICEFFPKEEAPERDFLDQYLAKEAAKAAARKESEDPYVRLARTSLESYIRDHRRMDVPADLPAEMLNKRAGVFVSIHEHQRLRGCIGTIAPVTGSIAEEILRNAISASTEDPRFEPIKEEELEFLEINVDVLGEPERISGLEELDVKRYGVIVSKGRRRGLLLPDLDGVDTPAQQVSIARRKAGIGPDEEVELERFEVVRHQ
ncbi:MAG: AmmeMemoRadiSam system protein A [Parasporobacterium sp.]|nr:AmmeMemoRadiSam system protein A [Parasporobacterium sp.]